MWQKKSDFQEGELPTIITHSFTGIACGAAVYKKSLPRGFLLLSAICSVIPDADVICFRLGVPYSSFWGHRGFFHSLLFASVLGSFTGLTLMMAGKRKWKEGLFFAGYFSFIIALHGVLDAFTNGGLGIALLSPFITERYFFPFTPIEVSPINVHAFLDGRGFQVLQNEIIWVWVPCMGLALLLRIVFRFIRTIKVAYLSFRRVLE